MALGVKTKPEGYFEIGDLVYIKDLSDEKASFVYSQPTEESNAISYETENGYLGIVIDNRVDDVSKEDEFAIYDWLLLKLPDNKQGYIQLNAIVYTSKANPEYDYPDAKKSFDWNNLFNSVTTLANSIFSNILNKNSEVDATALQRSGTEQNVQVQEQSWLQRNMLFVILFPLGILLLALLLFRKKEPNVTYVPIPNGKKINPNVKL